MSQALAGANEADGGEHPSYEIASYTVYPTGFRRVPEAGKRDQWCLTVANGGDGWAIRWRSRCASYRGLWEFEPPPESRTADFLRRCRFNEHAALHRARKMVDDLIVDGLSFAEYVEHFRAQNRRAARVELASRGLDGVRRRRESAGA